VRLAGTGLVGLAVVLAGGCGGSGPKRPKTVPVSGQLMYKDKAKGLQPAAGATVIFNPKAQPDEKYPIFPKGTVKEDGTFQLTTYAEGDGAPEGEYGITVVWQIGKGGFGGEGAGPDKLGNRYGDNKNPKMTATVKAGGEPFKFEIE
jgi:hypothetical protein